MDEFGCLLPNSPQDAKAVRMSLDKTGSVTFPLKVSDSEQYNFLISARFDKIGLAINGGNPSGRVYVGVQGFSCHHFSKTDDIHEGYFAEKLRIGLIEATSLAEFWALVWAK